MNHEYFEASITSSSFEKFPKEMQELLSSIMSVPAETMITREEMIVKGTSPEVAMVAEGASPEVASVKVPREVPKSLRSPKPRPTLIKEGPKKRNISRKHYSW